MNEAIAVRPEGLGLISPDTLAQMKTQAELLWKSGLCPKKFSNPEQIIVTAAYGRTLDIPFNMALVEVHVINGIPSLSAKMQLALIRKRCRQVKIKITEHTKDRAAIEYKRLDDEGWTLTEYTFAEVPQVLRDKETWKNYQKDLLMDRCITRMARTGFSDVLAGFGYDPVELQEATETGKATPMEVAQVQGAIPKKPLVPEGVVDVPATEVETAVEVVMEGDDDPTAVERMQKANKPAEAQESLPMSNALALKAFGDTLDMMKDENQIGLAYDRFRSANVDDPTTLMEAYSMMTKRLAAMKEKK